MEHGNLPENFSISDAVETKRNKFSLIWLLPLIALTIGGWLAYKNFIEQDIIIKIHFVSGAGLVAGKTEVKHKGVLLGVLKKFRLDDDLKGVIATVSINRNAEPALRENTKFWLVEPKISLQGISGLETLVSGSYIAISPGDGSPRYEYLALPSPPPLPESEPGLHLVLQTKDLGSIRNGSPVHFRKIIVGDVQSYEFNTERDGVDINIHIKSKYAGLVQKNSRFWNCSGISITGDFSGLNIRTESIASIISGGIAFYNPETTQPPTPCKNGDSYKLYTDYKSADAGIPVTIKFKSATGLIPGKTKILFKGMEAGVLRKIDFNNHLDGVIAEFLFVPRSEPALNQSTRFWCVKPRFSFTEISGLDTLFSGIYVEMDFELDGKAKRDFVVLKEPPPINGDTPGLHITLKSPDLGSIGRGTSVYYRKLKVGSIQGFYLAKNNTGIMIKVHIEEPYAHLVGTNTRFWNASGISVRGDFSGIDVRTESLESIISGGIAFFNPKKKGKNVRRGHMFDLYNDYDSANETGLPVTIRFKTGDGLKENTSVKYRGVHVGHVKSIKTDHTLENVIVDVLLNRGMERLAKKGSVFWVVRPKLGIVQTSNLETLVTGQYISVHPGNGKPVKIFTGSESPPSIKKLQEGMGCLNLTLLAPRLGSIKEGVKLFYREVPVGIVTGYELANTSDTVLIHASIEKAYAPLIRKNTRFWNTSGVGFDFSIFKGAKIRMDSLESVMEGGIAFATPGNEAMGDPAGRHMEFVLHDTPEIEWLAWTPVIELDR